MSTRCDLSLSQIESAELVDIRAELIQLRASGQQGANVVGNVSETARARAEAAQLARENAALRETVLALHSELFGARLATKYLDKELAGRIQQLQLLGSDMRAELRDSLWAQVEAEILLQRHKTLVRVCRGLAPRAPRPPAAHAPPAPRTVRVRRSPHLGLGISVTGGREHGVPILISELEAGGPAALTGQLYVGDAILAINDLDLTQACHKEAVQALQSVKGDCALCVQFIATDDDDRLSEDNYRFPLYPEDGEGFVEPDASGATPTAPRTPEYNHHNASGSECDEENSCDEPVYDPHRACLHNDGGPAYGPDRLYGPRDERIYGPHEENTSYTQDRLYERRDENGPYVEKYGPREENGPYVQERTYVRNDREGIGSTGGGSVTHYADYNNINNLSILDMDDDSIKIEARLEMAGAASLSTSARSTPVHTRNSLKKKRKPQDWRTKGAYCAVSDAQSSDEPLRSPRLAPARAAPPINDNKEPPPSGYLPISIPSPASETSCALVNVTPAATSAAATPVTATPVMAATVTPTVTAGVTSAPSNITSTASVTKLPAPDLQARETAMPPPLDVYLKSKVNGDSRPRKETKGFRIGSARRVTEARNGEEERERKALPRLLPGRGDPDFGTPV
ncbi:unnamed protein product, partial [Brenthis ino]